MVLAQVEKRPKYLEDVRLSHILFSKTPEMAEDGNHEGK